MATIYIEELDINDEDIAFCSDYERLQYWIAEVTKTVDIVKELVTQEREQKEQTGYFEDYGRYNRRSRKLRYYKAALKQMYARVAALKMEKEKLEIANKKEMMQAYAEARAKKDIDDALIFVENARKLLSKEKYLEIWAAVNEELKNHDRSR